MQKLLGLVESSLEGYYAGGYIMCLFTRHISLNTTEGASLFNDFDKVFDLDEDYHLFVGRGPVVGGRLEKVASIAEIVQIKVQ